MCGVVKFFTAAVAVSEYRTTAVVGCDEYSANINNSSISFQSEIKFRHIYRYLSRNSLNNLCIADFTM